MGAIFCPLWEGRAKFRLCLQLFLLFSRPTMTHKHGRVTHHVGLALVQRVRSSKTVRYETDGAVPPTDQEAADWKRCGGGGGSRTCVQDNPGALESLRPFPVGCCRPSRPQTLPRTLTEGSEKLRELAGGTLASAPSSNHLQVDVAVTGYLDCGVQTLAIIPVIEGREAISTGICR